MEEYKITRERWRIAQDIDGNCFIVDDNNNQTIASISKHLSNKRRKQLSFLIANSPFLLDSLIDLLSFVDNDFCDANPIDVISQARFAVQCSILTRK